MSHIADRFRPRLGPDWPKPLPAMLDAMLADAVHDPENLMGRILQAWSADEDVYEDLQSNLRVDALAFSLSDHHGGEWGNTYFGPWGSMRSESGGIITAPPRHWLDVEAVGRWRERAKIVEHHVARARFSDAAWDLAVLVGLQRRRQDAQQAIDSYIGQCANSQSDLHQERCLRRAQALARAIGDSVRAANVRTSLMELCKLAHGEACERLRFLACDLFLLDKRSDAEEVERATIVGWMENGLAKCVEQGDPFDGERFAERLDLHYRRVDNPGEQKRVARSFGGLLEGWASKGNGMLAMHNYKKAHKVYQSAGLSDEAKAVRTKVQSATARSQDEMAQFSSSVEIPVGEMNAFVESIVGQDWPEALRRFVTQFLHRRAEFEQQLDAWLEGSTMYGLMPLSVVTESGDSVDLGSPQEDRESHVLLKGTEVLRFAELFMARALDELFVRHDVDPEKLVAVTDAAPLFSDDRRSLMKRAMKAYMLRDYITFMHLAIPQVEHAIRLLFREAAQKATTTSRDSRRWRTLTLNQVLDSKDLVGLLGEDLVLYLRIVLTHDLGLNMRNLICHGVVPQAWFGRGRADRLFHVVLLLALLIRTQDQTGGGTEPTEADGGGEEQMP